MSQEKSDVDIVKIRLAEINSVFLLGILLTLLQSEDAIFVLNGFIINYRISLKVSDVKSTQSFEHRIDAF